MDKEGRIDSKDREILKIMQGNARISFEDLGSRTGLSRVGAMKRVRKLEESGIIRQYNTCIYRDDEIKVIIDIYTKEGVYEEVLDYIGRHTAFVRQIFGTSNKNHIHILATSTDVKDLNYLLRMIQKKCGDKIDHMSRFAIKEVYKDVYGGVEYEREDRENPE